MGISSIDLVHDDDDKDEEDDNGGGRGRGATPTTGLSSISSTTSSSEVGGKHGSDGSWSRRGSGHNGATNHKCSEQCRHICRRRCAECGIESWEWIAKRTWCYCRKTCEFRNRARCDRRRCPELGHCSFDGSLQCCYRRHYRARKRPGCPSRSWCQCSGSLPRCSRSYCKCVPLNGGGWGGSDRLTSSCWFSQTERNTDWFGLGDLFLERTLVRVVPCFFFLRLLSN